MKIVINRTACAGHARCHALAAEMFVLDDDGYIATDSFSVPPGSEQLARRAARACPERALEVLEADSGHERENNG
ncbi:ferredoxin [Pseudomaricurvus alcaniphilus]|uniref:ferredoxin n=1 Tax=Pseudomaricurvus alcaniphilus TaxID=1166482 RepID=UPI00140D8BFC|nr:ferredoxin [Pseudomaricurvus alcaniphilus]NHN38294.1 ferredoxin [Pseudomaricurvus alcaniphilus]